MQPFAVEYYRDMYEKSVTCSDLRRIKAKTLFNAATMLKPEVHRIWSDITFGRRQYSTEEREIAGVYLMLAGMAIENLLKGILVIVEPAIVKPNYKLDWKNTGGNKHDLIALWQSVGITLNNDETILLQKFTNHILWDGRFPVPKMAIDNPLDGSFTPFFLEDEQSFEEMFDKVESIYHHLFVEWYCEISSS